MKKAQDFKGTGVAIVTPFKNDFSVDFSALEKLIHKLVNEKADYLVVLGTTGETATLSPEEKSEIISFCAKISASRIPLVLGMGSNDTLNLKKQLEKTDVSGYSAILSVSPYYNKPNQTGIYQHYKIVNDASPLPVIMYNVPGRTGSNVTAATTLKIANDLPNIIATKEASGNMEQIMQVIKNKPASFEVISGDDNLTLPIIAAGGIGVISVTANACTEIYSNMVRKCLNGDFDAARLLHYKLTDITDMFFAEGSPGGVKTALKYLNICEDTLRLPLFSVSNELKEKIISALKQL